MNHKNSIKKEARAMHYEFLTFIHWGGYWFSALILIFYLLGFGQSVFLLSICITALLFELYVIEVLWRYTLLTKQRISTKDVYSMFSLTMQNESRYILSFVRFIIIFLTLSLFFLQSVFLSLAFLSTLFLLGIINIMSRPPQIIVLGASDTDLRDLQNAMCTHWGNSIRVVSMLNHELEHSFAGSASALPMEMYRVKNKYWKDCLVRLIEIADVIILDMRHLTEHVKHEMQLFGSGICAHKKRIAILDENTPLAFQDNVITCTIEKSLETIIKALPEYSVENRISEQFDYRSMIRLMNIFSIFQNSASTLLQILAPLLPFYALWLCIVGLVNYCYDSLLSNNWYWTPFVIGGIVVVYGFIDRKTIQELSAYDTSSVIRNK